MFLSDDRLSENEGDSDSAGPARMGASGGAQRAERIVLSHAEVPRAGGCFGWVG